MPRPELDPYWITLINYERAENPRLSAAAIRSRLRDFETMQNPVPSEGAIQKHMKRFDALPEARKQRYQLLRFPQSFQPTGPLSWDLAEAAVELLGYSLNQSSELRGHPPIRVAEWFWRMKNILPLADIEVRLRLTAAYTLWDLGLISEPESWLEQLELVVSRPRSAGEPITIDELPPIQAFIPQEKLSWARTVLHACGIFVPETIEESRERLSEGGAISASQKRSES